MEDGSDDSLGPDGAFSRYADGLHAYAHSLLRDPDAAADATVDALLVAGAAADELADRTRVRPWLYALVRNEALRRCPPAERPPLGAEAAELTLRHRLSPADVAAVLGHPAEYADRLATAAAHTPAALGPLPASPGRLGDDTEPLRLTGDPRPGEWRRRTRLAAERRSEVVRRARPFDADGFPVPVDRPRLSARTLVWSAATAVAIALVVLITLPVGGRAETIGPGGPALAAAAPQLGGQQQPRVPAATLTATRVAAPTTAAAQPERSVPEPTRSTAPRPAPVTDRGGDRRVPAGSAGGAEGVAEPAPPPPAATPATGRAETTLTLDWSPLPAYGCERSWTAEVTVVAAGAVDPAVTEVEASWAEDGRERSVTLQPDGDDWTGTLPDLPRGDPVPVTVTGTADGVPLTPAREVLTHEC